MRKTLIIAEKPSMGRSIAAAIAPKSMNKQTYIEHERYIITWAIGHLVSLAEPDHYDTRYKRWQLGDLPIMPESFKLVPYAKTSGQLKVIAQLAKRCDTIVNACDAGREGQLIFSFIQQHLRFKHPVQRLWISDLTPETIRQGFANLKDDSHYNNLTKAARARSEADWIIGMNGTRALTTKHNVLLSVGRVQTPVLALIYDRHKDIESFHSQTFYEVQAEFIQNDTTYKGTWQRERVNDRKLADAVQAKISGQAGRIESYDAKLARENPPKLYDLTLLQREANAKFGYSAKKTLDIAQALYETHKVISYPRTNSNYVNEANINEMHRALEALRHTAYDSLVTHASQQLVHKNNRNICQPARVEDHHAILPTHKKAGRLNRDEHNVYDLIVRRFLAHFYEAAQYNVHTVITIVEGESFKTTVKQLKKIGWKVVEQNKGKTKDEQEIDTPFKLDRNLPVICSDAVVQEKETKPPKHYTEGTLLRAMEGAGKLVDNEELREAMKDSGLGTPATRASIIERLKKVQYIRMQGKRIMITPKGRMAIELIRSAGISLLTSPEMTGQWEKRLNEIAKGEAEDVVFMNNVKRFTFSFVDKVRAQQRAR